MKKHNLIILSIIFFLTLIPIQIFCQDPEQSIMDINNITLWVRNDGFHDWLINNSFCSSYPKGTAGAIFTEGICWGGKVFDENEKIIRVNGCTYGSGNSPLSRLFRVRPDYFKADVTDDASNFFLVPKNQVTDSMRETLYKQYEKDWNEWPAEKGAPFYDVNKNGKYEPDIDIPGVPGASQTIWINYIDDQSENNYGSPQIGLDIRETYWAYNYTTSLGNVIYKKVDIIYKGKNNSPSNSKIDSMYICQFTDVDDGDGSNDFIGCDTSLNMGYVYNSSDYDAVYSKFFPAPPAVGYSVLNGPAFPTGNNFDSAIVNFKWRRGYKYFNSKPLTVFIAHRTGGIFSDPSFDYTGSLEFYNLMRGYRPEPHYPASTVGGHFNGYGTYMLDGDPVTKSGWIDGIDNVAGARSFWAMSGPLNMKLNDTVETVYAIVGGLGSDHIESITKLRNNSRPAILEYNYFINAMTTGQIEAPNIGRPKLDSAPDEYFLYQNYPNPFNSTTVIIYEQPDDAHVQLIVYDILGRIIKTLVDEEKAAGRYEVKFNADNLASGIYFYKISFTNSKSKLVYDNLTRVNKFLLLK